MTPNDFAALVSDASLSPSVHNIQPTCWRQIDEDTVALIQADGRTLPAGDPSGRDVAASHGAAAEGFILAAGLKGLVMVVQPGAPGEIARLRVTGAGAQPDPLAQALRRRRTYRGAFTGDRAAAALDALTEAAPGLTLVRGRDEIDFIARLNDVASLKTFRNKAVRAELLAWMRLSPRHPRWSYDGLNAPAMEMSGFEAFAAGIVLRPGVFETLDRIGLSGAVTGEAAVVRSSAAVILLHAPEDERPFHTGRRWHRAWLGLTALGLTAAPMTVLGDDPAASDAVAARFGRPSGQRLVTALRVGVAPESALTPPARRPIAELIL